MKISAFCQDCSRLIALDESSGDNGLCPKCGARLKVPESVDVFLSYTKRELEVAKQIAAGLREKGITCWFARDSLKVGDHYHDLIEEALTQTKIVVLILSSAAVQSKWVKKEVKYSNSVGKPIFPFMVENLELPPGWPLLITGIHVEKAFRYPLEIHIKNLVSAVHAELRTLVIGPVVAPVIVHQKSGPRSLKGVNPDASPYLGPKPFTPDMSDRFFGRDDEAKRLIEQIAQSRVVLVYAPSGAGKSSLLNTAIRQTLEETGYRVQLGGRVGGPPREKTLTEGIRNIYTFAAVCGLNSGIALGPGVHLTDFLNLDNRSGPRGRVLVFDQFEELFTSNVEYHEHRVGFFHDLCEALNSDPTLRLLFAMREEYLAKYEELEEVIPIEFKPGRFHLKRIDEAGALEAIIRPAELYAEFAEGVAKYIVDQLNTRKVLRDGAAIRVRAEFIEMVHLQIVCDRLWKGLPPGITRIEREHVEGAGGDGRSFDEFVVNALDAFYDMAIEGVSNDEKARSQGFSDKLIRLGCMKFVTPNLTRTMVKRVGDRVGRLPSWIVGQLENSHLLRHEQRGDEQWYELAHDRLADPVGRRMDREVVTMLYATDLLEKMLENEKRGGTLDGYFTPHTELLKECEPFHGEKFLLEDETEFIFRASLCTDQQMREWSARIGTDYPDTRFKVLQEALRINKSSKAEVRLRQNAAILVGDENIPALSSELLRLLLSDRSLAVRRAAALSLAQLDEAKLYDELTDQLCQPENRLAARQALSLIRVAADRDSEKNAPEFEICFKRLAQGERWKIQSLAWSRRFLDGLQANLFIGLLAGAFSVVPALMFKLLLGIVGKGLELTGAGKTFAVAEAMPSPGASAFHGLTAGFIWAGTITLGLSLHHLVFLRRNTPKSYFRPVGAVVSGIAGGLLGSILIVLVVAFVFTPESLQKIGWITRTNMFWRDIFVTTRYGCVFLITGMGLGAGMALMTNGLRASKDWSTLVQQQRSKLSGFRRTKRIVTKIMRTAFYYAWPIPLMVALAASAAFLLPKRWTSFQCDSVVTERVQSCSEAQGVYDKYHKGDLNLSLDIVGDCTSQIVGGFFGMVGMGLGIIIIRCGIEIKARKRW